MKLLCFLGLHRPSTCSMTRRGGHFVALCESCARPLERAADGTWRACDPLYRDSDRSFRAR
ncbi:hypothetical protein C7I55_26585 [Sphingomonas deserti]|uniref:Uncharacterized protein n=1 Tax=Allosphingosinicella deserti TaxID=2116704 RepID=A0A2P7QEK4_9SPHN|nr:hypothetical protein C7I55_26585 [Sphingomonas deserti]